MTTAPSPRLDLLALQQTEWEEQMPQKQIVIQEQ